MLEFPRQLPLRGGVATALILLSLLAGAPSLNAGAVNSNYFIRTWQVENGLPQNTVTAVIQTREGYIWAGTYNGLVRFDGSRFTIFNSGNTPGLKTSRITSLFEDAAQTLWIGHEGGELSRLRSGRFEPAELHPGWGSQMISSIYSDEAGELWLVTREGLLTRFKDGLALTPAAGPGTGSVLARALSANGKIWVGRNGVISVLKQGQMQTLAFAGEPGENYVRAVYPSRDGGLWVVTNGRVRKWKDERWVEDWGPAPWGETGVTGLIEMRSGTLAAGTAEHGLYLISPGGQLLRHYSRTNGLPSDWVETILEDRENNLWVGMHSGLVMLRETSISTVIPPDQWQGRAVLSVTPGRDETLWIGTEGAGLYRLRAGEWSKFGTEQGLPNPFVWSVAEDAGGRLWGGTWGQGAFAQRDGRFEKVPGLDSNISVLALLPLEEDEFFAGTSAGLLHYQAGKTNWITRLGKTPLLDVRAIVKDREGRVWFGMFGGGLGCLAKGELKQFGRADGMPSDFIQCLRPDEDGSLWIGTFDGGLIRLKQGKFAVINERQGLPNNVICHIEEDAQGFFWMSSQAGIMRALKTELNACADGLTAKVAFRTYDLSDGMPTIQCSGGLQPAGCKTPDGGLWFPTGKGLVGIDPLNVKTNQLPPPVVIESVAIDDVRVNQAGATTSVKIPPGSH
ncbi:MAG: hypothetical protein H7Y43_14955, partial [Akkermansiaceae bacterium]|nr:hypothetical protein [Verrucomicrobiales bacterium]